MPDLVSGHTVRRTRDRCAALLAHLSVLQPHTPLRPAQDTADFDFGAGDYRGARHSGRTQQLCRNGRLSPRLGLLHHVRAPYNVHRRAWGAYGTASIIQHARCNMLSARFGLQVRAQ